MKRWMVVALLGVIASIIHVQVLLSGLGEKLEPSALDLWFNIQGTVHAPEDVVLIAMDESSYSILDIPMDQAWPRALHAQLLQKLAEYKVKRVVMDILFLGESQNAAADQALAAAIKNVPTVIGADSGIREQGTAAGRYTMEELLEPPPMFSENAEKIALVRMPDDYGHVRRFHVVRSTVTRGIPTLHEAAAGKDAEDPTLPGPRDFLRYYGPPGTIITIPYHQLFNEKGKIPEGILKNRVVFVGLNLRTELGPSQKDSYLTPYYERGSMFGVEIQATSAANLLTNDWIRRSSRLTEGLVAFFLTLILSSAIFYLRPQWAGVLLFSFSLLWALGSYLAFLGGFFLPGVVLITFVLPTCYLGSTLVYYLVTHRSQQAVEKAFQLYVSPEMAKQMRANPKGLQLGGENVWATAMFTDIAGFTDITEHMIASQVSDMLNAYFTEVMEVVFKQQGTLIKFIGDAAFVLWGAPIKSPNHAQLAAQAALDIQRAIRAFNATQRFPALHTRVGVHTGQMVVGNLGSSRRFDYTAIGDSVNLASRVEGLNKYFGTDILVTETTRKELGTGFFILSLGNLRVKGKKDQVPVSTLFESEVAYNIEQAWTQGLRAFKARKWADAREFFNTAMADSRLTNAAALYLGQIIDNEETPPDEDWAGEIVFGSK